MNHLSNRRHSRRSRQQGAALYVALIMLILLALIGIVGMQVAGLQERMAANYRTTNLAFQNAEALARTMPMGHVDVRGGGAGSTQFCETRQPARALNHSAPGPAASAWRQGVLFWCSKAWTTL